MEFDPAVHDVQDLIRDYKHDFGIRMSYKDAERISAATPVNSTFAM
jgi:hypothetical protein